MHRKPNMMVKYTDRWFYHLTVFWNFQLSQLTVKHLQNQCHVIHDDSLQSWLQELMVFETLLFQLPLLRWKRFAVAAAMCILAVRAVVVQLAFYLHMQVVIILPLISLSLSHSMTTWLIDLFSETNQDVSITKLIQLMMSNRQT